MSHGAGCLCGAVRFTIDAEPLGARSCWCRLCQYLGAGGPTTNVIFPADKVTVSGTIHHYESIADSGNHMRRGFCPACGTPLTSETESRPHLLILRAGTLDDPGLIRPQMTIWSAAAPAWACIDEAIPNHPAQMPPTA